MSTKIAVIAGDYSNGWSDAWIVQMPTEVKTIKDLSNDKEFTLAKMNEALMLVIKAVESNEKIVTKPKDEACCGGFESWLAGVPADSKFCGLCATPITNERRTRFAK